MNYSRAFYFVFFAALAGVVPYLALYYQDKGFSGREIGFLTGLVPLVTMVGASLWGMLSDATGRHRLLFAIALCGVWVSVFLMTQAESFNQFIPIVVVYAFFFSPIIPLTDNSVVAALGERSGEYGRIRVWGSYGWGLAALFVGVIIERYGLLWGFGCFMITWPILFFLGYRMPMSTKAARSRFWRELRILLAERHWILFLIVALIEGMSLGIFLSFLFLYLEDMGSSRAIMGLALTMATLSEIPVFLYSQRLFKRWNAPFLLAMSLFFTVVRSFAYVSMTAPWQVLLINLLHGPTFALMWAAGVAYANQLAPPGLGATAQGVFSGMVMGLGSALGAFSGGFLYDAYGAVATFWWAGAASLIAFFLFVWTNRHSFRQQLQRAAS
jgi:PPP family 3-phenylpropionic acid transporter